MSMVTESALKWCTYTKECYAEYASMKAYEDYIYGRWFYVYNEHQNLLQIAQRHCVFATKEHRDTEA